MILFCKNVLYLLQKLYVILANFWIWVRTAPTFFDQELQTSEDWCATNLNPSLKQKRSKDCGSPSFLAALPLGPRACSHSKVSQKKRKRLHAIESWWRLFGDRDLNRIIIKTRWQEIYCLNIIEYKIFQMINNKSIKRTLRLYWTAPIVH